MSLSGWDSRPAGQSPLQSLLGLNGIFSDVYGQSLAPVWLAVLREGLPLFGDSSMLSFRNDLCHNCITYHNSFFLFCHNSYQELRGKEPWEAGKVLTETDAVKEIMYAGGICRKTGSEMIGNMDYQMVGVNLCLPHWVTWLCLVPAGLSGWQGSSLDSGKTRSSTSAKNRKGSRMKQSWS